MSPRPAEDLFENTRMSFGEHLEELRVALIRSLIGVAVGCVFGFLLADRVVNFLQRPLVAAIKDFHDKYAIGEYKERMGFLPLEISTRMQRDGLSPDRAYIDPGQLVQAIRTISPDSLSEIDLTPYRFSPSDVTPDGARAIAAMIVDGQPAGSVDASRLAAVTERIGRSDRDAIKELVGRGEAAFTLSDRDRVVAILNRVLEDRALHDAEAFVDLFGSSSWSIMHWFSPPRENQLQLMKAQVDLHPDDVELSRRLNRLLVAETFPDRIPPPTIPLVPVDIWRSYTEGTQALSPHEVFMVWLKAAVITGLIISAPWVFYQVWLFVAAGLYPHEQKYVYLYLPLSLILFALGCGLAFFFVFDPVLNFLFSFNASMGIKPQLRIGEWLSFVLFLPLGFGVSFQLPLVMLFLQRITLVATETYVKHWRMAVMIISILSMLLTPADPVSMILMAVPLTVLYFFGIALCRWMPAPRNPFNDTTR